MGSTLSKMQGLMIVRENSPSPVFSDLPASMATKLRTIRGVRVVAPEVWKIAPPISGKEGSPGAALNLLIRPRDQALKSLANMVVIEGQDLPEHLKLKSAVFAMSILPKERGGGRFLTLDDIGKPNVVISTKIAEDFPNTDGTPKRVGQTLRIGTENFTIVGLYETGSLFIDVTIVLEIGVARKLLGVSADQVSTFDVEAVEVDDTDPLGDRIEAAVPGVRAQRISQYNLTIGSIMGKLDLFLLLAVGLAMLVGGVGIANTMLMSTSERYVEFGVMRTNGWTRGNVLTLVVAESALLGVLSGILGSAMAAGAVYAVNPFLKGFELDLKPWLIVMGLVGALSIAVLSGLYPAWRASRMTPMDAIRHSAM